MGFDMAMDKAKCAALKVAAIVKEAEKDCPEMKLKGFAAERTRPVPSEGMNPRREVIGGSAGGAFKGVSVLFEVESEGESYIFKAPPQGGE